jgi:hypothetical protein
VVAERDHVGTRGENLVGQLRRQPGAVGGVLSVDDAEVDVELLPERPEPFLDRASAGRAENVRDEEEPQGRESVAAG